MIKDLKINERILYIIDNQYNSNQKKFADSIGFAPQVVNNIVSAKKNSPSFGFLNAIISINNDICAEWLLTGKGEMLKRELNKDAECNCDAIKKINELQDFKIKALEKELHEIKKEQEFAKLH